MVLQPIKMIILGEGMGLWNNMDDVYVQRFPIKGNSAKLHWDLVSTVRATFFPSYLILATALWGRQNGHDLASHYPEEETRLSSEKPQGLRFGTGTAPGSPDAEPSAASRGPQQQATSARGGQHKTKQGAHPPSLSVPSSPSHRGFPLREVWKNPESKAPPCSELGL